MRRASLTMLFLLVLAGIVAVFYVQGEHRVNAGVTGAINQAPTQPATTYLYYTLKQPAGFVLARAPKGSSGQPLGNPQPVAGFGDDFGLAESDSVLNMQLSPDGLYLAINGTRDHGEQVWVYDTQHMTLSLTPPAVLGNFLHWLPVGVRGSGGNGGTGHTFLYRPMFPLGPTAPLDGNTWNPGLWEVDAASGAHQNIDIGVPSAYLIDAAPSPDGSHIIYSTTAGLDLGSDTWLMNSDGSGVRHLFSNPGGSLSGACGATCNTLAALFTWSPDGKSIAYERLADSSIPFLPAGLWVMDNAGGQQRRLADADGGHGYIPVWSPDSHKIAFVIRTNADDRQANISMQSLQTAIAVVDVTTSHAWTVASAKQTGMQLNLNPTWTADSAYSITFTASNPVNRLLGGSPRYWSARVAGIQSQLLVSPLTPTLTHIIATS
ncbi:MAG: hypothetical protein NVSMB27_18890 [Ktedonobacteraceae bacterium]